MEEIYKKLTFDFSNLQQVLLSTFHFNGHTSGFYSLTQKLDPSSITQKTVPRKVLLSAFHLNGHFLGPAFLLGVSSCLSCLQGGYNF